MEVCLTQLGGVPPASVRTETENSVTYCVFWYDQSPFSVMVSL